MWFTDDTNKSHGCKASLTQAIIESKSKSKPILKKLFACGSHI